MYFVYVIYNQLNRKIYVGQTIDLERRLFEHNKSQKNFTGRFKGEWKLIYHESLSTRSEALRRERQLKSFRGREYIRSLID